MTIIPCAHGISHQRIDWTPCYRPNPPVGGSPSEVALGSIAWHFIQLLFRAQEVEPDFCHKMELHLVCFTQRPFTVLLCSIWLPFWSSHCPGHSLALLNILWCSPSCRYHYSTQYSVQHLLTVLLCPSLLIGLPVSLLCSIVLTCSMPKSLDCSAQYLAHLIILVNVLHWVRGASREGSGM